MYTILASGNGVSRRLQIQLNLAESEEGTEDYNSLEYGEFMKE